MFILGKHKYPFPADYLDSLDFLNISEDITPAHAAVSVACNSYVQVNDCDT